MYRVILVDDEYWALKANEKIFRWAEYGFEVAGTTTDAQEAIDMILQEKPDVVFVDINMPEVSGFDLIAALQGQVDTKFIIVTAYSDFHFAQKAIQYAVFEYCVKPIGDKEARRILERLKTALDAEHEIIDLSGWMARYDLEHQNIDNAKFKKILAYIFEHVNSKLNLGELAEQFDCNPNYCSMLFNKYFDCGFSVYVAGLRMMNASKMLRETDYTIEQVAQRNGYEDYYYFNKVFKKIVGMTPSEYKKQFGRKQGGRI